MSQEPGLFSVRRPREASQALCATSSAFTRSKHSNANQQPQTLGALNHNVSAIPMPASAMKRTNPSSQHAQAPFTATHASSRMSLAPGRPAQPVFARSSSGTNLAEMPFSTVQRTSSVNMFNSTGGRKSMALFSATTPAPALQFSQGSSQGSQRLNRRSSVFSARQSMAPGQVASQSFFAQAPVPAGVMKDPRPLKDRAYQAQIGQELMDYMSQHAFEQEMKHALTNKTMSSPTQKDFNYMFQWLYNRIDPGYRFMKSIDAEVPPILKQLRYPFEKSITKSQLSAVGGQNWSTFLGMLHWLMQLAKQMEQYALGTYDDACVEAGFEVYQDRIRTDFMFDAYSTWLSMDDDQDDAIDEVLKPHIASMVAKLDEANAKYLEQVKQLEAEQRALQDQIDELEKRSKRAEKLDEQIKILEEDRVKFETYEEAITKKLAKQDAKVVALQEGMKQAKISLLEAEQERSELQAAVDKQGIPMQEIDRMNSESERLKTGLENASQRLAESRSRVSKNEASASQKLETLERAVQDYNSVGYQIGIIPASAELASGQDFELHLNVNEVSNFRASRTRREDSPEPDRLLADPTTGYQPQHLLNLDIKGHVKNGILSLRKTISERKNAAAEEDMKKKELLDQVKDAMEERQQEVEGLSHRLRAAETEFERTKENCNASALTSAAQIENLERELRNMRTTMTESVQHLEQREMNTNLAYEQLTLKAASLREELHTEIEKMLNDVIKFKVHVQQSLESYEEWVSEEVERECEEGVWGEDGNGEDVVEEMAEV